MRQHLVDATAEHHVAAEEEVACPMHGARPKFEPGQALAATDCQALTHEQDRETSRRGRAHRVGVVLMLAAPDTASGVVMIVLAVAIEIAGLALERRR